MRLTLIAAIASASLFQSSLALLVHRASADDMKPLLGMFPQVKQGDTASISAEYPPQTISKYTLVLKMPDGTVASRTTSSLFITGSTGPDGQPTEPTTRFCTSRQPFDGHRSSISLDFDKGANGYEYDADRVCISPPFTSETVDTVPQTMNVAASSGGTPTTIESPSPTPVELQATPTGSPYLLSASTTASSTSPTTSTSSATSTATTVPNGAPSLSRWRSEVGIVAMGLTLLAVVF
ncbi:hypothetical protein M408DRAFT_29065 [Serendipita vermifera MAFF 305830]|uniref:Ubiquitin 3 binding protein But2 C-terminal domain-containing protein n=1 Tax=Serendipita vermifera MAFF 305830 TaxID=933852 RepID=A0A0C2WXI2_SERVB|nr:hypothetical protein M408DRAFT_29065 [Serendipita vermifera MAFF 305830]